MPIDTRHPREIRADIRRGKLAGITAGLGQNFVQANLAVLPKDWAYDFLVFCQRNPRPCPLIEVTDPGSPEPVGVAPGADLRTDIPRYRVYADGVLADEVTDATPYWRDDLVAFLLGCSFTFEWALLEAGVRLWPVGHGRDVAVWRAVAGGRPAGRVPGAVGGLEAADRGRAALEGGPRERALPRRPRRARPHRRSGRHRHRGRRPARLGGPAGVPPGRRAGVLGVRRDAAGRGARVEAAVHAHAQPGAHVHHGSAQLRPRGDLSVAAAPGGRSRRLGRIRRGDQRRGEHPRAGPRVPDPREGPHGRARDGADVPLAPGLLRPARGRLRGRLRGDRGAGPAGLHGGAPARAHGRAALLLRHGARPRPRGRGDAPPPARGRAGAPAQRRGVPRLLHRLHAGPADRK